MVFEKKNDKHDISPLGLVGVGVVLEARLCIQSSIVSPSWALVCVILAL